MRKAVSYILAVVGATPGLIFLGNVIPLTRSGVAIATAITMGLLLAGGIFGYWIGFEQAQENYRGESKQ